MLCFGWVEATRRDDCWCWEKGGKRTEQEWAQCGVSCAWAAVVRLGYSQRLVLEFRLNAVTILHVCYMLSKAYHMSNSTFDFEYY